MLQLSFIISFIVMFLHATTRKGHIFGFIYECTWNWKGWKKKLKKPLFDCPICMTPWWGLLILLLMYYVGYMEFPDNRLRAVLYAVLILFAAAGISTMLISFLPDFDGYGDEEEKSGGDE